MIEAVKRLPPLPGITGTDSIRPTEQTTPTKTSQSGTFNDVLQSELNQGQTLTFSAHAQSRLLSRQIQLTPPQMERLQKGVQDAAQKGAKESLVVMDHLAFIVSVANRTVVTAVDGAAKNGNVFTQIDSAVIV
ncbi:MAG: TIGR02530 family flagellar biosynthesis protein [Calditrichota bacterium]